MIDELTPDQVEQLRAFHAEWYGWGTCTAPADRDATEAAITRMYELIDQPAPQFVWCDSPATGTLAAAISLGGSLRGSLRDSLRGSLWDSLRDSLRGSLWDSLRGSLGGSLRGSLRDSLRGSLGGSLWDSLRDSLRGSLGGSLRDSLRGDRRFYGQHEAHWVSFYLFPEQHGLVSYAPERSEQLALWAAIARSSGWWFPYEGIVFCTERPEVVRQEMVRGDWPYGVQSYRLHCEDGPALAYRDGWSVYSWHGVRVPEWVIMDPVTDAHIDRVLKLDNSEHRRAGLERVGWTRVIENLGSEPLAVAPDPGNAPHDLLLYALPEDFYGEPVNLLVMTNGSPDRDGSPRVYGETVPAEITDPVAAAAWQYGVDPSVYATLARRT